MHSSGRLSCISLFVSLWWCAGVARAQDATNRPTVERDVSSKIHTIGLRFETDGTCFSYGVFYAHYWLNGHSTNGLGPIGVAGFGVEARLLTEDHRDVDAILLGPIGRAAMAGDGGGASA